MRPTEKDEPNSNAGGNGIISACLSPLFPPPHHLQHNHQSPTPAHLDFGQCSPMITRLPAGITPPGRRIARTSTDGQQRQYQDFRTTSPVLLRRPRSLSLGQEPLEDSPLLLSFIPPPPPSSGGGATTLPTIQSQATFHSTTSSRTQTDENQTEEQPPPHASSSSLADDHDRIKPNPVYISFLYGAINAAIVLPVIMSFGTIIYSADAFHPYLSVLIRLTLVSGVVHQLCFSTFSSLPFSVGSVQDAGLIFLSSISRTIAEYCDERGIPDDAMLATSTIGLGIATAILGCGLILVGKLRLAQYVQLLPTAVIGGYLAFIGWFCGWNGIKIMASGARNNDDATTTGATSVTEQQQQVLLLVLPGILCGIGIYILVRWLRHMAVLPTCILTILIVFHVILWATGTSIAEATDLGWIRKSEPPPPWYHTWEYLQFDKVQWAALPSNVLTLFSMIFVVALSSSLDVAAIELELQEPLNYNQELSMVGLSNVVSGLTGGYTGSYIFSQSIFSLRAGITSRVAGFCLASFQIGFLILPFPILSYVPNVFFGSLLVMIAVDLVVEWLWEVRHKLNDAEYAVCLATFLLIQWLGVEFGILAGIVVYLLLQHLGWIDRNEVVVVPPSSPSTPIPRSGPNGVVPSTSTNALKSSDRPSNTEYGSSSDDTGYDYETPLNGER